MIADAIRKHLPAKAVVDAIAAGQLEVTAVLSGPGCFGNFIVAQSGIAIARPPELRDALSAGALKRQGATRGHNKRYVYVDTGRRKRGGPPRPPASYIIEHLENVDRLCAAGNQVKDAVAQAGLTIATYYAWRREFGRPS